MPNTLDLLKPLPKDAQRPARFCHRTITCMIANPLALPGERDAQVYSARFTSDDTGTWTLDALFKTRNRLGKLRNHRVILSAGERSDATCQIDGRPVDMRAALHPFRNAPHKSQFPSIFAKHFIKHAG